MAQKGGLGGRSKREVLEGGLGGGCVEMHSKGQLLSRVTSSINSVLQYFCPPRCCDAFNLCFFFFFFFFFRVFKYFLTNS